MVRVIKDKQLCIKFWRDVLALDTLPAFAEKTVINCQISH